LFFKTKKKKKKNPPTPNPTGGGGDPGLTVCFRMRARGTPRNGGMDPWKEKQKGGAPGLGRGAPAVVGVCN